MLSTRLLTPECTHAFPHPPACTLHICLLYSSAATAVGKVLWVAGWMGVVTFEFAVLICSLRLLLLLFFWGVFGSCLFLLDYVQCLTATRGEPAPGVVTSTQQPVSSAHLCLCMSVRAGGRPHAVLMRDRVRVCACARVRVVRPW